MKNDPKLDILNIGFGHAKTVEEWACIDATGKPIPWYTYPAIEYINQLDISDKTVFEYGSGNSSLFWSSKAKSVTSIEESHEWYEKVKATPRENLDLRLIEESPDYEDAILQSEKVDVIVIDGSRRLLCAQRAVKRLQSGGMIILDNSDWYVKAAEFLRDADFLQVDMSGFGPINNYTWTTSFFFDREFRFKSRSSTQPQHGIGGLRQYAEEEKDY